MRAHAVIGCSYGDEGKGLVTDYLCSAFGADVCVRFNGGAQAGHTVVTPSGERHVFHHFGAGTFAGAVTFLSRHFVVNPILFNEERLRLTWFTHPVVYVDPEALVTTPFDMLLNQGAERARGDARHGSCGVGVNETVTRSEHKDFELRARHLTESGLHDRLTAIAVDYVPQRRAALGLDMPGFNDALLIGRFLHDITRFLGRVKFMGAKDLLHAGHVVFEGAQGLMLDQNNAKDFPHLTRSNTGLQNVLELADDAGLKRGAITPVYVTRPYLTRHGSGPLPGELPGPPFAKVKDDTNVAHTWQGTVRYAHLDVPQLLKRVIADAKDVDQWWLCMTCVDHVPREYVYTAHGTRMHSDTIAEGFDGRGHAIGLRSFGPTRADVSANVQL